MITHTEANNFIFVIKVTYIEYDKHPKTGLRPKIK